MYIHTSSYSLHSHIPFSVWGENLVIIIQNIVIVILFWIYSEEIQSAEKIGFTLFFSTYSYILYSDMYLTELQWEHITQTNIIFLILSRIPQIYTNFISKSTGNLALATFFFAFGGSTARMATVLFETDDLLFQM
jgi:mannose-P-dolichol utilization defect protein 1